MRLIGFCRWIIAGSLFPLSFSTFCQGTSLQWSGSITGVGVGGKHSNNPPETSRAGHGGFLHGAWISELNELVPL